MGIVFYTTVVPIGLIMRLSGKDPLRLAFDRAARSYWIERDPPSTAGAQMKKQF
jgi:hypothetical protein